MRAAVQLDLRAARAARDEGITRAADHADGIDPGWAAGCYRVLETYASHTAEFTSVDFREHLKRIGFPVPVPKALGGPFQKAARAGLIVKAGFEQHPERHCSPTPRWRSLVCRSAA
jgi:hypothetical protein